MLGRGGPEPRQHQHANAGLFERLASLVTLPFSLTLTVRVLAHGGRVFRSGQVRL